MIEHLKILSHPAVWAIFATDIIGWNCHFHLMTASTSSAVCSLHPSYCQSYCSSIYDGYAGSTLLEATNLCTPALSSGFFSVSASVWSWGNLGCVGSLLMSPFLHICCWELFCEHTLRPSTGLLQELRGTQRRLYYGVRATLRVQRRNIWQSMLILQCSPVCMKINLSTN